MAGAGAGAGEPAAGAGAATGAGTATGAGGGGAVGYPGKGVWAITCGPGKVMGGAGGCCASFLMMIS